MYLTLEVDREADGRFIAEVTDLPGVLAYGATEQEAVARAQALALRVLADRLENGEPAPSLLPLDFRAAQPPSTLRMREWPSMKARRVLAALFRIGWSVKREASSHKVLARDGWADTVFAFHDGDEVGPRMLARIAKRTGLRPEDL